VPPEPLTAPNGGYACGDRDESGYRVLLFLSTSAWGSFRKFVITLTVARAI
jgi:hypothetical protein